MLVLEARQSPESPLKRMPFGMRGLWGPSMEALYRRGLLDAVAARPSADVPAFVPQPSSTPQARGAGHFAGLEFDYENIDTSRWSYRLAGPADGQLVSEMEHLESVLAARAVSLGVEIQRGHGVDDFETSGDEVVVRAGDRRFHAKWLVGCDGGRSTVRKLAGFDFVGTEPELTGYSLKIDVADPEKLPIGRYSTEAGTYTQWQRGWVTLADFDGGAYHRSDGITREHVQEVLRRMTGTDVTITALHLASTWTDRSKQATTYRKGRVLLAGDAAHIHSPLGGQGLNLGLGDAMNLGWKLAATIRGDAPEGLLGTYTSERHPIGARILDWTRAQVAAMRPDRGSRALQAVLRDLVATRDGATYCAERVWSVSLRYDLGDPHPLVGRSCPDFELEDGARVGALLRDGRALLLDFDRTLVSLSQQWGDRVRYVGSDAKERLGVSAVLVRPDGFVAWASDRPSRPEDVVQAATRWLAAA